MAAEMVQMEYGEISVERQARIKKMDCLGRMEPKLINLLQRLSY